MVVLDGVVLKAQGMAQVLAPEEDWLEKTLEQAREFCEMRRTFIAEEFRLLLIVNGWPKPHHHNAWGALWKKLPGLGWIVLTPEWRSSKAASAHARMQPLWRSKLYKRKP